MLPKEILHRKPDAGAAAGQTKEAWEDKGIPGGGRQGQETYGLKSGEPGWCETGKEGSVYMEPGWYLLG